jgi:Fe-S-cluster containining protein
VALPTPADVIRVADHTGIHPYEFLEFLTAEEIDEVEADDSTWLECDDDRYIMALKRDDETGCTFLDKKTKFCSIYEARPMLCRLYPFNVKEDKDGEVKGFTLHEDVGCPRHRDGKVPVAGLKAIYEDDAENEMDYDELVEVFNKKKYFGKKPRHFLRLFFEGL